LLVILLLLLLLFILCFNSKFQKDQRYLWLNSLGLINAGMWDKNICSKYFKPQQFMVGVSKNTLLNDAVPIPIDFKK